MGGSLVTGDTADTFLRYDVDGSAVDIPIERLGICGFGRAASNTVVITDTMASREHAMIRRNATGHCILNDLGSTNGTFLNGRPISMPSPLRSGDVIQIGRQVMEFIQTAIPQDLVDPAAGRTTFLVEQQLVSVLVIDLRGYTGLSAAMGETAIAAMMGEIFHEAGAVLNQAGCWSTKFIGDAIMALWVHSTNAITRKDMVTIFDVMSAYQGIFRVAEGKYKPPKPLRFGCGLNAGMASIGNIGSAGSADFTAMGEAVNIAFRLETATKAAGCDVLIARDMFEAMTDVRYCPANVVEVDLKGYVEAFPAVPMNFDEIGGFIEGLLAAG